MLAFTGQSPAGYATGPEGDIAMAVAALEAANGATYSGDWLNRLRLAVTAYAASAAGFLLREDGGFILRDDGGKIALQ